MFQWLLVRKYLLSKVMPLLASLAVLMCTAMVLITWSVMGGFLDMLVRSGRTVTGDVIITWPNIGFPHYDELVKRLEADPQIAAACPMIETYGLLGLPDGANKMVVVRGVVGESYARVTSYNDILWWKPLKQPLPKDKEANDPRARPELHPDMAFYEAGGKSLSRPNAVTGQLEGAAVLGIEVSGFNYRREEGYYLAKQFVKRQPNGSEVLVDGFMPRDGEVVLSVLPLDRNGRVVEQASRRLPVANEFQSGLFEADEKFVLVRMDVLQQMLRMDAAKRVQAPDPAAPRPAGEQFATGAVGRTVDDPARVTHVLVRGKGDLGRLGAAENLRRRVDDIYAKFAQDYKGEVPRSGSIQIFTWEDHNRTVILSVQKETGLLLFLFCIISLVAVFLVLAIFWSMIAEKTKDIGVLRALGAGRKGIAGVWVLYGLAIGVVGASLGLIVAFLVVRNINPIHEWIGTIFGVKVWDPAIYYFTVIPNRINVLHAIIVMLGGVLSSVLGAIIPAWRAARMDPVRALRFE